MISNRTDCTSDPSPAFRVMTSHFSGVVTMIWVLAISALVSCMSPVSSRTLIPSGFRMPPNLRTTSCASAFMGATYTILNWSFCSTPWVKLLPSSWHTVSMATLVLPAPVGAHTSKLSLVWNAAWYSSDCRRLSFLMPCVM